MSIRTVLIGIGVFLFAHCTFAQAPLTAIAFSPEGDQVISASQEGIRVYSWPELELKTTHKDVPWSNVHDLAFSPDGHRIAVGGGAPTELGGAAIFQWPDWQLQLQFELHDDVSYRIAWSADGEWLASASADRQVVLVNVKSKFKKRLSGHSQPVTTVTFASTDLLVSAGVDHSLRVWNAADGKLLRTLENHRATITDLAPRPAANRDQIMVASCGEDATVRLWQPAIGRLVRFARLPSVPMCIAWTPGGETILAGCRDGHVRAIDPSRVEVIGDYQALDGWIYCIAVHSDGSAVVGGEHGRIARVILETR